MGKEETAGIQYTSAELDPCLDSYTGEGGAHGSVSLPGLNAIQVERNHRLPRRAATLEFPTPPRFMSRWSSDLPNSDHNWMIRAVLTSRASEVQGRDSCDGQGACDYALDVGDRLQVRHEVSHQA